MEISKRFDKETLSAFYWLRHSQISMALKRYSANGEANNEKYDCSF